MADYSLSLSEAEVLRYQTMAKAAYDLERDLWTAAGVRPGARVADVGAGPGAVSVLLAELVGPAGQVWAVDQDGQALAAAEAAAGGAGLGNLRTRQGNATQTGLAPASMDVVMLRHVLAHNGGMEQAIVDHLAAVVRPGGCVYLVDIDASGFRLRPPIPELDDLNERYGDLHARRGNDLSIGLRLDELLSGAGLEPVEYRGIVQIIKLPPGLRPPAWAARQALLTEGLAVPGDLDRWAAVFERLDRDNTPVTVFAPQFVAIGQCPG